MLRKPCLRLSSVWCREQQFLRLQAPPTLKSLSCPNRHRPPSKQGDVGAIIRHGFYTTRWGKRRRYQCQACGKTVCSTNGTPYDRLQQRRATFDEVTALGVEGLNKSAIVRVKQ